MADTGGNPFELLSSFIESIAISEVNWFRPADPAGTRCCGTILFYLHETF